MKKNGIFEDVMDDFSQIHLILFRFRDWKYNFSASYEQAYMPLCLPKLLAPYISLQLLFWNPLDATNHVNLKDMPWFQNLLFYDCNDSEPDDLLIPRVVELIVIPKLTGT